jgi:hypothetical protein
MHNSPLRSERNCFHRNEGSAERCILTPYSENNMLISQVLPSVRNSAEAPANVPASNNPVLQDLPRTRTFLPHQPQRRADEHAFFSRSDSTAAHFAREMLSALSSLARTFTMPPSIVEEEGSVGAWKQQSSEGPREQEAGREPRRDPAPILSSPEIAPVRNWEEFETGRRLGRGTSAGGLEGRVISGGLERGEIPGGRLERGEILGGSERGLTSGGWGREVDGAEGGVVDFLRKEEPAKAYRQIWDVNSKEQAGTQAAQNRPRGGVHSPRTVLNYAPREGASEEETHMQAGVVRSTAQDQGVRPMMQRHDFGMPMQRHDFGMPMLCDPVGGSGFQTKRSVEAGSEEFTAAVRAAQEFLGGGRPQGEPLEQQVARCVERYHDQKDARTAMWEFSDPRSGGGLRVGFATPSRLRHTKSADTGDPQFLPQSVIAPWGQAAGRPQSASDRVHDQLGLHSGASYPLGGASLGGKDFALAASGYRSNELVPGFQKYHCGEWPLEPEARAPPDRLFFSREAKRALPRAVSQPLPAGHVYQRGSFSGGEVTSLSQESAARMVGNVSGQGAVRKQFSVPRPRPLNSDAEMRSLRGEKRPLQSPREGERRWGVCFLVNDHLRVPASQEVSCCRMLMSWLAQTSWRRQPARPRASFSS